MAAKKLKDDFEFQFNIIKGVKHVALGDIAKKHRRNVKTIRRACERGEMKDILWHGNRYVNYESYLAWETSGIQEGSVE